jgi:uncharacterized protein YcgI (DUF1989 family)
MEPISITTVPGYEGKGVGVPAGSRIRITDVEGRQVGDLFALVESDPSEYLCPARTRSVLNRLFPQVGEPFYTNHYRPVLTFISDESPGIHDTLYAACDPGLYAFMGASPDHASCYGNFLAAAEELGLHIDHVPDPVNLFQNTPVGEAGRLIVGPALTQPGEFVEFRAELDLYLILTACCFDLDDEFIGGKSTRLKIEVFSN